MTATDVFVPPGQLPVLVDTPDSSVTVTADLVDDYEVSWVIDWDSIGRDADDQPVLNDDRRLTEVLRLDETEPCFGDPEDAVDAAITRVAVACLEDCDRSYRAENALTTTLTPSRHGVEVTVTIDVDAMCRLARASSDPLDHAHAMVLDSLRGDGTVNLMGLATWLRLDVLRALFDALEDVNNRTVAEF